MSLDIKDGAGVTKTLATGFGDGSGTPFKSPTAVGIGDVADAAVVSGSVSGSVIAILKGIFTSLIALAASVGAGIGTVVGTISTTLGTINTSNSAISTSTGAVADAAVASGSVSGSIIAILKGVYNTLLNSVINRNLLATPIVLFNMTTRQAGVTQKGLVFPTTIACTLPTLGGGTAANITNSANVCGGAFSPLSNWSGVLLDFACVGPNAADTLTIEIGRVKASTGIAEILASAVLTASATTLAVSINPFTGVAHSAVTWRFSDTVALTLTNQIGSVMISQGGTSGNLAQLYLNCHDVAYYYVVITALSDGGTRTTEVMCVMTPVT